MGAQGSAGSQGSMGSQNDQSKMGGNGKVKGQKTVKGCIRSEGGQTVLEDKHGKMIAVTGQDLSAHVGHEVKLHGTWEKGASDASGMSASGSASGSSSTAASSNNSAGMSASSKSDKTFAVSSVDMVSDTCKAGKSKNSSTGSNSTSNPQQ
jgi:hypothetical protein